MIKILVFLLFCDCFGTIIATCENSTICLHQFVNKTGYHRTLRYLLEVGLDNDIYEKNCSLCIYQTLPSSLYVDNDQLRELQRLHQLSACAVERVDVEKPKHLSPEINIHMYASLDAMVKIDLPIHLRYQSARFDGGYEKIVIPQPSLLIICDIDNKFENEADVIQAPCSSCSATYCKWVNYSYDFISEPKDLLLPIGNLNHYPFVVIITLLVTCAGCVYILSSLALMQCKENVNLSKKQI